MKRLGFAAAFLLLCCVTVSAGATDTQAMEEALPAETRRLIAGTPGAPDAERTLETLWEELTEQAFPVLREAAASAAAVVGTAVLCSLVSPALGLDRAKTPDVTLLAGALAITALSAGKLTSFLGEAREIIRNLSGFSKALLPTLTAASAASGQAVSGAAKYAVTAFFMDLLITLAEEAAMPLVFGFVALSFGAAALGNGGLEAAARLLRRLVTGLLTVLTLAFTIFLSTTGAITGTADATAAKLTRTAVSAALPVVGGIVSDASAAVVSAAAMIRASAGIFGLLGVCALCLLPVLKLAIYHVLYRLAGALAAAAADERLSRLITAIGDAMGMLLGIAGACAMMLFLSVTCLIRSQTG